jgi:hypothetical protein
VIADASDGAAPTLAVAAAAIWARSLPIGDLGAQRDNSRHAPRPDRA